MKQLSGMDTAFLSMETPTTFGHIASLSVYRRPTEPNQSPLDLFRSQIEARLGVLEPLRRRLAEVPFDLDRPWWIEDPSFDLDFHVRHIAVPAPGGDREVADLVGRIISQPLDRTRPLWEAYVIEGLADDRWAVLLKIHHAALDGAAGAELQTLMLDDAPTTTVPDLPVPPAGESVPSPGELLARTAWNYAVRPQRFAAAQTKLFQESTARMNKMMKKGGAIGPWSATTPAGGATLTPAPPTPFNRSITPHRRLAYKTARLSDIKAIKTTFGVTVNDVVMAACAGALRVYLERHGALTNRPLMAGVPVSIRTGNESDPWTNRVSALTAPLPTHLADPIERLHFMSEAMVAAKGAFDLVPADALSDFSQFSPPAVFAQAATAMTRYRMGNSVPASMNLIISNVPGPRQALYLGSARLEHYYPVSTVAEGQGLNITVQSYEDKLDIGIVACRELVPDLWDLLELVTDEIDLLMSLTGIIPEPTVPESASSTPEHPRGLDPRAKAIIDLTANAIANGAPPMWEMTPPAARAAYRTMNGMMGSGEAVESVENRVIPGPDGDLPIRIYRPSAEARGAFVYYHGGGFVIGDLETHDRENRRIANRSGAVVISVDYRLAPEHPFPAATDDAWAALSWVIANADDLGIDPKRVAVGGDSAGGNLAAVTALRAKEEGVALALQVLIYPAVDIADGVDERYPSRTRNDGLVLSREVNDWFIGAYAGGGSLPQDKRLTPIREDLSGLAPALVITAEFDPLRDEGRAYAERLSAAGTRTTLTEYPGQIHGFFNLAPAIPAGWDAVEEVAAALRSHLR